MFKTILRQVRQYKWTALLTPLWTTAEVIMGVLIPYVTASIIDKGINAGNITNVYRYGALMLIMACFSLLFGILSARCGAYSSSGLAANLREAMYRNIQRFSFSDIDKFSTAGLVTRMTTDVSNIESAFQMLLRTSFRAPLNMVSALFMCFFINGRLSLIFLAAMVILSTFLAFLITRAAKLFKEIFKKYDDLNGVVQENVSAIRVVKAYVREHHEMSKFDKAALSLYTLNVKAESLMALNHPVMNLIVNACIIALSWWGAHFIVEGSLTTGQLTSLFSYITTILGALRMLSMIIVQLTQSAASGARIAEVINEVPDMDDPADPVLAVPDGSVDFDHVYFSYKKGGDYALEDINLHIRAGETIGIIGGTGSGKSSLINLIPRFYDAYNGSVKIDGRDVKEYNLEALRERIGIVPQKAVLFHGSLRDNLKWGKENATDEEIYEALKIAQAKEVVDGKENGLDYMVAQSGKNFSGGQRQRLTIARALVRKPEILILDDSASALDYLTDKNLREAIAGMNNPPTTFIVSQRTSAVLSCDKIIVLDNGSVAGIGTHDELMERCDLYKEIYDSQFKKEGAV